MLPCVGNRNSMLRSSVGESAGGSVGAGWACGVAGAAAAGGCAPAGLAPSTPITVTVITAARYVRIDIAPLSWRRGGSILRATDRPWGSSRGGPSHTRAGLPDAISLVY